jgi:hypothetical protein
VLTLYFKLKYETQIYLYIVVLIEKLPVQHFSIIGSTFKIKSLFYCTASCRRTMMDRRGPVEVQDPMVHRPAMPATLADGTTIETKATVTETEGAGLLEVSQE